MGAFTASLYHKEQKLAIENKECGNCIQKGHVRKDCPNEAVCYDCRQPGHKKETPHAPLLMITSPLHQKLKKLKKLIVNKRVRLRVRLRMTVSMRAKKTITKQ